MPYRDPDPQDPMVLVGVELPASLEAQTDMAYAFAEEFARMGFTEARILSLFREPFYAGAHGAYRELGEAAVLAIIRECGAIWGRARPVDRDVPASGPGATGRAPEGHGPEGGRE